VIIVTSDKGRGKCVSVYRGKKREPCYIILKGIRTDLFLLFTSFNVPHCLCVCIGNKEGQCTE
jgi:hypothetical protein